MGGEEADDRDGRVNGEGVERVVSHQLSCIHTPLHAHTHTARRPKQPRQPLARARATRQRPPAERHRLRTSEDRVNLLLQLAPCLRKCSLNGSSEVCEAHRG